MKDTKVKDLIAIFFIIIFLFICICIKTGWAEPFDRIIYEGICSIKTPILTYILIIITNIGGLTSVCLISLCIAMIMFILKKRKYGIGIVLNVLFSSFTYIILKNIFQRSRPPVNERLVEETGYSFPSGHATNNMAFYGFIIYLIYKNVKNKMLRNILITVLLMLIIFIGFSRVYLRVHYPSDVIAGFCLGIVCVIVFVNTIYNKITNCNVRIYGNINRN